MVDREDQAFKNPKSIGPFYTAMKASRLKEENGWTVIKDSGRGYRRVVPSPKPVAIVESGAIKELFNHGVIIIACGGGGILVVRSDKGRLQRVEGVIDKDYTATTLATLIGAEIRARKYLTEGQFPPGNMGPKIESAIRFIESGGEKAVTTSLKMTKKALKGNAGTNITR